MGKSIIRTDSMGMERLWKYPIWFSWPGGSTKNHWLPNRISHKDVVTRMILQHDPNSPSDHRLPQHHLHFSEFGVSPCCLCHSCCRRAVVAGGSLSDHLKRLHMWKGVMLGVWKPVEDCEFLSLLKLSTNVFAVSGKWRLIRHAWIWLLVSGIVEHGFTQIQCATWSSLNDNFFMYLASLLCAFGPPRNSRPPQNV